MPIKLSNVNYTQFSPLQLYPLPIKAAKAADLQKHYVPEDVRSMYMNIQTIGTVGESDISHDNDYNAWSGTQPPRYLYTESPLPGIFNSWETTCIISDINPQCKIFHLINNHFILKIKTEWKTNTLCLLF